MYVHHVTISVPVKKEAGNTANHFGMLILMPVKLMLPSRLIKSCRKNLIIKYPVKAQTSR
jgi:hypothetical protein